MSSQTSAGKTSNRTNGACAPHERLGGIANGYMISAALNAAVRLGIADALADGPLSAEALADRLRVNADALGRVLRMLSCLDVFEELEDNRFANTAVSDVLRADHPQSQRDMINFVSDPFHMKVYADMVPTITDGRTGCEHVFGKPVFDVFAEMPDEQERFDKAMTNLTVNSASGILASYDFSGIKTLVDVAGGHGLLLSSILQKYENMQGILFDLPHVVPGAKKRIEQLGLTSRCSAVAGDFFQSVPEGDAIIMKHIIHDWDDDKALKILQVCRRALRGENACLLLAEMLLSGPNELTPSKFLDVEMLMLPGGRERTAEQFSSLLSDAGFRMTKVVPTRGPICVIEAVPV